ncbi:MAG: radical SAM protein [Planctomycetes bacterium]|nr:radical SAM protein [Planctomycetota bacterium]
MPIGMLVVAERIDRARHEVKVLDLMFGKDPVAEVRSTLRTFRPDLVGISVRNIDNQSARNTAAYFPELRQIVEAIRAETDVKVVLGGTAFSTLPRETLDYTGADLGMVGEAQAQFADLVDRVADGRDYADLPGLVHRKNGKIVINDWAFPDLGDFSDPPLDDVDFARYMASGSAATVVKKLGCPFRCSYCDGRHRMGTKTRLRSPQKIVDDLIMLQERHGIRDVFIIDPHFNVPLHHAKAFCREVLRRNVRTRWQCTLRPGGQIDGELLHLMKRSGCQFAIVSPDSCSEKMLKGYNKLFTKQELRETCLRLQSARLPYVLFVLFGGPGETRETVEETMAFVRTVKPKFVSFTVGIRIVPETALAEQAIREGIIASQSDLMEPTFYISPAIDDWIDARICDEWRRHPRWIFNAWLMSARQWVRRVGWRLRMKKG